MGDFWKMAEAASLRAAGRAARQSHEEADLGGRLRGEVRRLSSRHAQLDTFFAMVAESLERGSLQAARAAFVRLCDALDAHITLEDDIFFPALVGLSPELSEPLSGLADEHSAIRGRLEGLHDRLAEGSAEIFAAELEEFAQLVSEHELREETLLSELAQKQSGGSEKTG